MPPRKLLSENPPPADSSSEEDEDTESEESEEEEQQQTDRVVHDQNGDAEKQEETDDDGSDSDDDDEDKSPLKKHATSAMSDPDLDSGLTQPSPSLSAFTIKLHKPSPKPNKSGLKRSTGSEESMLPTKKKSKAEDEPKKGPGIQRLWSEGDELAILDGLIKYKSEKGADPNADMAAFHKFIKGSLHVDVSKSQLSDKIRRLKQKYRTNVERGENGQDPLFSKPHDRNCFELSKKIWAGNDKKNEKIDMKLKGKVQDGGDSVTLGLPSLGTGKKQQVKYVEKSRVKSREEVKTVEKIQKEVSVVEKQDIKRDDEEGENHVGKLWDKYPLLGESFNGGDLSEGAKLILGDKLWRLEKGKLEELELKWKCLKEAELDLFVQRCELLNQQVKLALDFINS